MSKILFLLLMAGVIYWWLHARRVTPPSSSQPKSAEDMVRCVHCGVHLPRSEALGSESAWFCCEAHRRDHEF
ncbi:MAG: PP0621 family protein [Sulfuriferula sp.]|nr:PP0621 family protein [Sulfuriferula sp.]